MTGPLSASSVSLHDGVAQTANGSDAKTAHLAKLEEAARDFEAVLLRQMLASLGRSTKVGSGQSSGGAGAAYGSMVVESVSQSIADSGGLGMADFLVRQLASQVGIADQAGNRGPPNPAISSSSGASAAPQPELGTGRGSPR